MSESAAELLNSLARRGATFWLEGERLCYRAPRGALSDKDFGALKVLRGEITAELKMRVEFSVSAASDAGCFAPLTEQQLRLWQRLQKGGTSLLHAFAARIHGTLNVEYFAKSIKMLIHRHGSLRTNIRVVNGEPLQFVRVSSPLELQTLDYSDLSSSDFDLRLQEVAEQITKFGCDLATDSLFEVRLLTAPGGSLVFLWSIHHIISDGNSSTLVMRELWENYAGLLADGVLPQRPRCIQYRDYALWQRYGRAGDLRRLEDYWRVRLTGARGVHWPDKLEEPCSNITKAGHAEVLFDSTLSLKLHDTAANAGTTVALMVLTIYIATIARSCHQDDFVLTTYTSGRDRAELESMAGYCSCGLYIRVEIDRAHTFFTLLKAVSKEWALSMQHQDFGSTVANRPELGRSALFQWMPWREDERSGVPPLNLSARYGISGERVPLNIEFRGVWPFPIYETMAVFWGDRTGIRGAISSVIGSAFATSIDKFVYSMKALAEQVVSNDVPVFP